MIKDLLSAWSHREKSGSGSFFSFKWLTWQFRYSTYKESPLLHITIFFPLLSVPHLVLWRWWSLPSISKVLLFRISLLVRMGQRHNRRRTRRSSNRNIPSTVLAQNPTLPVEIKSTIRTPQNSFCALVSADNSPNTCISRGSPPVTLAPSWHYGYTAWQTRERPSRLESNGLEEAQCRLFGGEPGDDVSLCYRMLEYFGGLDYIDSWVSASFLIHFKTPILTSLSERVAMPLEIECLKFPSGDLAGRIVHLFFFQSTKKTKHQKRFHEFATFMTPHSTHKTKWKTPSKLYRQRDALRLLSPTANAPTPHWSGKNARSHGLSRVPDL